MAKTHLTVKSSKSTMTIQKLSDAAKRSPGLIQKMKTAYGAKYGQRLKGMIRGQYSQLFDCVADYLEEGIAGGPGATQASIRYSAIEGGTRTLRQGFEGLSEDYLENGKDDPKDRFWRNKLDLTNSFAGLSEAFESVTSSPPKYNGLTSKDGAMVFSTTFVLGTPPEPLNSLMTKYFVAGEKVAKGARAFAIPSYNKSAINAAPYKKLTYVEGRRPFITRLSAEMGNNLVVNLRRGLK